MFKPDGEDSYDMTAYVDTDGTGYLIRSVGNVFLGISALTPDFLDTTGICSWGPRVRRLLLFTHAPPETPPASAPGGRGCAVYYFSLMRHLRHHRHLLLGAAGAPSTIFHSCAT